MRRRAARDDLTRADQLAPGDQWIENRTWMTMIERCTAPLSNVVRLRVRRADGGEQLLDPFATDKRLLLHPSSGQ
jgi:hypothetical protein